MKKGDHLKVDKGFYSHHGLYIGSNKVIHYTGFANGMSSGPVKITTVDDFSFGSEIQIVEHTNEKYSVDKAIQRAKSRIGEQDYNLILNNCEHFVNWCLEGDHFSYQTFFSYPISSLKEREILESIKDRKKLQEFDKKLSKYF